MKEEYRTAIEKIALSDNDKARILANVLKTCGNAAELPSGDDSGESIAARRPLAYARFNPRSSLRLSEPCFPAYEKGSAAVQYGQRRF